MGVTKGVQGGTRSGGSMCGTCRNCSMALGPAQTQEFEFCHAFGLRVLMPVVQCSRYDDKRMPSIQDMYDSAYYLTTSDDKKPIGFVTAREWRKQVQGGEQPGSYPRW